MLMKWNFGMKNRNGNLTNMKDYKEIEFKITGKVLLKKGKESEFKHRLHSIINEFIEDRWCLPNENLSVELINVTSS